jgi:hypothetical protein
LAAASSLEERPAGRLEGYSVRQLEACVERLEALQVVL